MDDRNAFQWTDNYGDRGSVNGVAETAYLTLHDRQENSTHSLDFETAQAVAFHLAVAPAQPEPQPGEFWWVSVDGRDSIGMIYASGSGLRVRCQFVTGSPVVTRDDLLEQCTLIGRVPPAQKGE